MYVYMDKCVLVVYVRKYYDLDVITHISLYSQCKVWRKHNKKRNCWKPDLEKRFKVVRGTVDKRVSTLRKETEKSRKKVVTSVEKQTRKYIERVFKQFKLPVRGDVDSLKRRLTMLERRIQELEKTPKGKAAAA